MSNPNISLMAPDSYPESVRRELEQLVAAIQQWANNGVVKFAGPMSSEQPRCRYYKAANQSIPNNTDTPLTWDGPSAKTLGITGSAQYDNGLDYRNAFVSAAGSTFIVPPTAGTYLVVAGASFGANAAGKRDLWIQQRDDFGALFDVGGVNRSNLSADVTNLQTSAIVVINDRDFGSIQPGIRIMVYQNSGGALDVLSGIGSTYFSMVKLS